MGVYLNDWAEPGFFGVVADFSGAFITKAEYEAKEAPYANAEYWAEKKAEMAQALAHDRWAGVDVLLASYTAANYSGDAFVLFRRGGQLYEVSGGHCSCHGLEDQWTPAPTSIAELRHRLDNGELGSSEWTENEFARELRVVLDELEQATPPTSEGGRDE